MSFLDRPQSVWWRRAIFQIHLWTGVTIGLYVIAVCLSGVALVLADNLQSDVRESGIDSAHSAPLPYQELVTRAQRAHPGENVVSIDGRQQNMGFVVLYMDNPVETRLVYMSRHSGRIVADVLPSQAHPYFAFFRRLHVELLGGRTGELVNGAGGVLLSLMCATGIVIWWPGRKTWKEALRVQWRARWARLNWDLHTAVGFWTLSLTAMWALTGAYFVFPQPFREVIRTFSTAPDVPGGSGWKPGQPVLSLDDFVRRARELYPDSQLSFLTLDIQRSDGYIDVLLSRDPSVPTTILRDEVTFEPASGRVLSSDSSAHWPIGYILCYWAFALHLGDFASLTSKVLWTVLGLVPVGLAVTGYLMWWNRVLKKKWQVWRNTM
jgi:uncharacterized iron-regulated membrane protein